MVKNSPLPNQIWFKVSNKLSFGAVLPLTGLNFGVYILDALLTEIVRFCFVIFLVEEKELKLFVVSRVVLVIV